MLAFNHCIILAFKNLFVICAKYNGISWSTRAFSLVQEQYRVQLRSESQTVSRQTGEQFTDHLFSNRGWTELSDSLGCVFNGAWNVRDVFCVAWCTWQCRKLSFFLGNFSNYFVYCKSYVSSAFKNCYFSKRFCDWNKIRRLNLQWVAVT